MDPAAHLNEPFALIPMFTTPELISHPAYRGTKIEHPGPGTRNTDLRSSESIRGRRQILINPPGAANKGPGNLPPGRRP